MSWNTVNPAIREIAERTLTPAQLEVWTLDIAGLSQREIAYRCDISRTSVVDRLDAADRRLRRNGVHKTSSGTYYLEKETPAA